MAEDDPAATSLDEFLDELDTLGGEELEEFILDNVDVPAYVNFIAVSNVINNSHWGLTYNVDQYRDARTGRWKYLPLDLDGTYDWQAWIGDPIERFEFNVDPLGVYGRRAEEHVLENQVFGIERFRSMYLTRVATIDAVMRTRKLADIVYREDHEAGYESFLEDHALWSERTKQYLLGSSSIFIANDRADFTDDQIERIVAMRRPDAALGLFESSQSQRVEAFDGFYDEELLPTGDVLGQGIDVDVTRTTGADDEPLDVIALCNPAPYPVDLSGWRLRELDTLLPPGSVLVDGGCGVVVSDDSADRRRATGLGLVLGESRHGIDPGGGSISLLRGDGTTAGWTAYGPGAAGSSTGRDQE